MCRSALADTRSKVVGRNAVSHARLLDQARDGAPVHAGHDQTPDVGHVKAGRHECTGEGVLPEGQITVLAEALLP